jgi:hypothetical protein
MIKKIITTLATLMVGASASRCRDDYINCATLAKNCCHNKGWSNGNKMKDKCCKSCKKVDATAKCKAPRCENKYSNCAALAKGGCGMKRF